ncbi:hypothetical protein J3F83DRAFT_545619 [Trichoderma novae-zelandiae]
MTGTKYCCCIWHIWLPQGAFRHGGRRTASHSSAGPSAPIGRIDHRRPCLADLLSCEAHELVSRYSHGSRGDASACCDRVSVPTSYRNIIYHIPLRLPLQAPTPPRPLLLVTWPNGTQTSKRNNLITQLSASRYITPNECTCICEGNGWRQQVQPPVSTQETHFAGRLLSLQTASTCEYSG